MPSLAQPLGIAVIGCGNISAQYLTQLTGFDDVRVLVCADLDTDRAAARAAEFGVPDSGTPEQALAHPGVELVVNLTVPAVHAQVAGAALAAGKHVWNEKPLTDDLESAQALLDQAAKAGLRIGCAPDTILGPGFQRARRLIAEGGIGAPLTALALVQGPGPDRWHPDPAFLYQPGAGPLFDLGPYYLSALATLFGPVVRVMAVGRRARDLRVVASGPKAGTEFPVEVDTHVSALLEFRDGQAATLVFSFDSPLSRQGFLEISGSTATLALVDVNQFDGDLRLRRAGDDDWTTIPTTGSTVGRGLGVLDMARAVAEDRPHRASGELALHVLEIMTAVDRSTRSGQPEQVHSTFAPPEVMPQDPPSED